MQIENLLKWLHQTPMAEALRENEGFFPWIESVHVIAICLVIGSIAVVDFRLLGLGSRQRRVTVLGDQLLPITWIAFGFAALTGALMFASNAVAYSANFYFLGKLVLIVLAGLNMLIFQFGIFKTVQQWDTAIAVPAAARVAAFLSLTFWTLVLIFGRWIGFTLVPAIVG
jgi:hypothetical protein